MKQDNYLSTHPSLKKQTEKHNTSKKEWFSSVITNTLPTDKKSPILEIGFGLGEGLTCLSALGYDNIDGIDNCKEMIDHCPNLKGVTIKEISNIFDYLEEHENHYDLIIMYHVLEHFQKNEIIPLINAIFESLCINGKLLIVTPNISSPIIGVQQQYSDFTHETAFSPNSILQISAMSKFQDCIIDNIWPPGFSIKRRLQRILQKAILYFISILFIPFRIDNNQVITHQIKAVFTK